MSKSDDGARGRWDYLSNKGWDWEFIKPNPPQPKQFFYGHLKLLHPTIKVEIGENDDDSQRPYVIRPFNKRAS